MWCIRAVDYHPAPKKSEIMPFAARRMDLETVTPSEVQSEKDKHHMNSFTKQKQTHKLRKQTYG